MKDSFFQQIALEQLDICSNKKWTIRKCGETDLGMVTIPYIYFFILKLIPRVGNCNSSFTRKKQVQNPDHMARNAEGGIEAP